MGASMLRAAVKAGHRGVRRVGRDLYVSKVRYRGRRVLLRQTAAQVSPACIVVIIGLCVKQCCATSR